MARKIMVLHLLLSFASLFAQVDRIDNPVKNFDKLWSVFNDRYANFELKNVNWDSVYKAYRPLINERTTNDSLFKVCNKMLLELKDGHVNLIEYGRKGKVLKRGDDGSPSKFLERFPLSKNDKYTIYKLLKTTDSTLRENGFIHIGNSGNSTLEYYKSEDFGYLRILSMGKLSSREYKRYIDDAVKNFKGLKGVIIDIRFNGGGDDKNSMIIASRFTDKKRVGFLKKERINGTSRYKKMVISHISPAGQVQYTGPIVILTSDLTASAAEVFALAMKELPYVSILGDNTNGIFSDMFDFKLPNGWLATLSHQKYFSANMKNFEGIGVEPDIEVKNTHEDIITGRDQVIIEAIDLINQ
ncbi:S41 family peptidase [Luteirhabdus pelagi]|uniref:S41 family peptidase n=1 Tax=Luteirhabdus pelagi TaxID=2792783 RepID=UPI0019394DA7|nr:S41 family peptidase [Luteirhabdus pelagi]